MYTLGLIGYPITHSLSPWIHESFLQQMNLRGTYDLFEIAPDESLADALEDLKEKGVQGFNVTVPYKEAVMPLLDRVDDAAKQIGAVNTVVLRDGEWVGYNTDGKGYVRSLEVRYPELFLNDPQHVLILGAGGATRGIYSALLEKNCARITLANRTIASAEKIIAQHDSPIESDVASLTAIERKLASYDLIINTSSVGMKPHTDDMIISLEQVRKETIVSDIVYQPIETALLREAARRGCGIHFGHTMLLYQAQYAFELWTETSPTVGSMGDELQQVLEGN